MWEYRLAWLSAPAWWNDTWEHAVAHLDQQGRKPEERPDTYLLVPDRVDVGLKLRGGVEGQFDAKVMHARAGGWELWEKIPYFNWNVVEAARFATMISERTVAGAMVSTDNPTTGARTLLQAAGLTPIELKVEKIRMQAAASELLPSERGGMLNAQWLAELVQIRLPRRDTVFSLCLETVDTLRGGLDPFPDDGAVCCGYPELLLKYGRSAI